VLRGGPRAQPPILQYGGAEEGVPTQAGDQSPVASRQSHLIPSPSTGSGQASRGIYYEVPLRTSGSGLRTRSRLFGVLDQREHGAGDATAGCGAGERDAGRREGEARSVRRACQVGSWKREPPPIVATVGSSLLRDSRHTTHAGASSLCNLGHHLPVRAPLVSKSRALPPGTTLIAVYR
jgi:hypothetical protein